MDNPSPATSPPVRRSRRLLLGVLLVGGLLGAAGIGAWGGGAGGGGSSTRAGPGTPGESLAFALGDVSAWGSNAPLATACRRGNNCTNGEPPRSCCSRKRIPASSRASAAANRTVNTSRVNTPGLVCACARVLSMAWQACSIGPTFEISMRYSIRLHLHASFLRGSDVTGMR